jgi:hypothetical protein
MRRAFAERAAHQRQCQRFTFQAFGYIAAQPMAKHRDQRLGARVYASALAVEDDTFARLNLLLRCKLVEDGFIDHNIEAGIAAVDRMTDPVSLLAIEEQHLIGFRNHVALADMALEDAAIGIDEARSMGAFLVVLVSAFAIADDIADEDGFRLQQQGCRNL